MSEDNIMTEVLPSHFEQKNRHKLYGKDLGDEIG